MSEKEFSYTKAMNELEEILAEIATDELDLDVLSKKVKRATFLIKECKSRLRKTTDEINGILSDWEKDE